MEIIEKRGLSIQIDSRQDTFPWPLSPLQKEEAKPTKKVGKLNMGAFGGSSEKAPPPKRTGKIGSRFGSKFGGGSDLQKDGGSEIQQLK